MASVTNPIPLTWSSGGAMLTAMLHLPKADAPRAAILMLPGGTDYRIGSHRSYVRLAAALCDAGLAVLRLDVSGMGDSGGAYAGFEELGPDIASGIDQLRQRLPVHTPVILWGQCDGASAILLGLGKFFEVEGAILCNPWVRTAQTAAAQVVQHHYRQRLASPQSWQRILKGQTNVWRSFQNLGRALRALLKPTINPGSYLDRIGRSLAAAPCRCLVVIGEYDAAGQEFRLFAKKLALSPEKITHVLIPGGNHSFSTKAQQHKISNEALKWINHS
jgi:uncharacterized protein